MQRLLGHAPNDSYLVVLMSNKKSKQYLVNYSHYWDIWGMLHYMNEVQSR
jgi:hypothetical protein